MTIEAVAARANVGRPTVYRWWPDRHAVAMAALMETDEPKNVSDPAPASTAKAGIRKQLRSIADRFVTPTGRHIATMIAASDSDSELSKSFRNHFVMARRAEARSLLERAMADGELRGDLDLELLLDLLFGPIFFRLLMGHQRLSEKFVDQLVDVTFRSDSSRK